MLTKSGACFIFAFYYMAKTWTKSYFPTTIKHYLRATNRRMT